MLIYAMLAYIVDVESNNDDVTDGFTLSSFGASEIQNGGEEMIVMLGGLVNIYTYADYLVTPRDNYRIMQTYWVTSLCGNHVSTLKEENLYKIPGHSF